MQRDLVELNDAWETSSVWTDVSEELYKTPR